MRPANEMDDMILKIGGTYLLNHAKRDFHLCKLLAEKEGLAYDESILRFACWFHDISAFPPYRPEGAFDHAQESGRLMPELAKEFGFDEPAIEAIVEAVRYHDKAGMGKRSETVLLRNADGVDYLGFMAVARDFSKSPADMRKAVAALKAHRKSFSEIIELKAAKELAAPRIEELDRFIETFERESFGMY